MGKTLWIATLACAAVLSTPAVVRAQPSTQDALVAQTLFDEGRRLLEAGKLAEACTKFEESQRLDPSGGTLLNLASCREREGRIATAYLLFTEALRLAKRDARADREALATERLDVIAGKLPKLTVSVPNPPPGVRVTVDGTELRQPVWGIATPIDPGKHEITATADGYATFTTKVILVEYEQTAIEVRLRKGGDASGSSPGADASVPMKKEKHPLFIPLLVVGGLGIVTAGVAGYVWFIAAALPRRDNEPTPPIVDTTRTVTLAGLAIGAPLFIVALALPSREVPARSASFVLRPGGVALEGTF